MDRKWMKFGLLLMALWLLALGGVASSYRSVESSKLQIEELGNSVDHLRSSFFFEAPYRAKMADRQSLDLQLIYALRLQIDAYYQESWLSPDLNQLLFTTDRFIEQAQAYLDNQLAVQTLAERIRDTREQYASSAPLVAQYFQLSANVFEAMYLTDNANAEIFRNVDRIYQQSNQLEAIERRDLQRVLVDVSQVLSSYAQGSYLVDKLIAHDVGEQITALDSEYHAILDQHIWFALALTLVTMLGFIGLLYMAQGSVSSVSQEAAVDVPEKIITAKAMAPASQPARVEPQINFDSMLASLNGDSESVCMLLEVFVADHADDVAQITRLLTESPEEAQRKAHSLKGVGGNLGAAQLREVAGKVEVAIQQDITQVSALLKELQLCLETAINEAQQYLNEHK
ncbi:Hpt domain-containing protein [Vibrio sinaloensis]|uniref:Hpt domain-containing protein n=1 Tax=Photobacterium sp. (strain ATCC 43367) TaxID=379097 RepID=UPI0035EB22E6